MTHQFAAAAAAAVATPHLQEYKQKAATDAACFKILRTRSTKARNNLRKERANKQVSTLLTVFVLRVVNIALSFIPLPAAHNNHHKSCLACHLRWGTAYE
jgi:hypothetical protein